MSLVIMPIFKYARREIVLDNYIYYCNWLSSWKYVNSSDDKLSKTKTRRRKKCNSYQIFCQTSLSLKKTKTMLTNQKNHQYQAKSKNQLLPLVSISQIESRLSSAKVNIVHGYWRIHLAFVLPNYTKILMPLIYTVPTTLTIQSWVRARLIKR